MKNNVSLILLMIVLGVATGNRILDALSVGDTRPNLNETVSDELLKKCIDNGDTQAVERARAAPTRAEDCYVSIKDQLDVLLLEANVTDRANIVERCRTLSTQVLNCTQSFNAAVYPCYSDQHIAFNNVAEQMMINFINYVCKPEHLQAFTDPEPPEAECFVESAMNITANCRPALNEGSKNKGDDFYTKMFEPEGCRKVKKYVECSVRTHEVCKKPSVLTFVDVVIGIKRAVYSAVPPCPEETTLNSITATEA